MINLVGRTWLMACALALAAFPSVVQAQSAPSKPAGAEGQAAAVRAYQGFGPLQGAGPFQGRGPQQSPSPYQGFGPLLNSNPVGSPTPVQGGSR